MAGIDSEQFHALTRALEDLDAPTGVAAQQLADINDRLAGPLRVVLAGRVSSGKSTLVNALLGQRVAPTDVSECTQVVTWFRYGSPQRIEIRLRDGSVQQRLLDADGRLPSQLGVPVEEVVGIDAWLVNDSLRNLTLIDTPGFSSAGDSAPKDPVAAGMTQASWAAAAQCDALVFVLNQGLRADELEVLQTFQRDQPGPASAVNTLGVLTKADKLDSGTDDPWESATTLAKRYAERHRDEVSDVLPIMGLLAETTECGLLSDLDVSTLQELAAVNDAARDDLLLSVDFFLDADVDSDRESRERLLELLDLHGIDQALAFLSDGDESKGRLRSALAQSSGLRTVRQVIADDFGARATTLRLLWATEAIQRLSYAEGLQASDGRKLRDLVEQLRLDPAIHAINEFNALQELARGPLTMPPDLADDLRRLVLNRDPVLRLGAAGDRPEDLAAAALAGSARWRRFRVRATPAQDRIARVAIRSYQLAYKEWGSGEPAGKESR